MIPKQTISPAVPVTLFLFLVYLYGAVGFAASPDIEVLVGFDNLFIQGATTSIGVLLRSPDAPLDGELILEYHAGTALELRERYQLRRPVSLPAGFSGVYQFLLPLKASTYPLSVRIEKNGILVVRKEVELRPMVARGPVVVGLSRRPSLDALIPGLAEFAGRQPELRYPRAELLPSDSRGWDGVALVLWHDLPGDSLEEQRLEALAGWVASGGFLVVLDGPWFGGGDLPEPFSLPEGVPGEGLREFGKGRILTVGAEYSRAGSTEAAYIMDRITAAGYEDSTGELQSSLETAVDRVSRAAFFSDEPVAGPVGSVIAVPLIFLVTAFGIVLIGPRIKKNSGRWMQVSALVFVALFSTAVVFLLPVSRMDDPDIRRFELVVAGNAGPVMERDIFRGYSPRGTLMDLPISPGQLPVMTPGMDTTIRMTGGSEILESLDIGVWREIHMALESLEFSPPSEIIREDRGLNPTGGEDWEDVVLIAEGEAWLLARQWKDGDILSLSAESPVYRSPSPGPHGAEYFHLVTTLSSVPGKQDPLILALGRSSSLRVLVHLGERQ